MLPASAAAATALRCSGRGTYDAHRRVCECPLGYEGRDCETSLLPACEIGGGRAIPIRSWILHEFHNRGSGERWRPRGEAVGIGPVPCECLRQLVAAPFLLERSRMIWLHRQRFEVRCVRLPPDTSLADLLARPSVGENLWRRFSFGAAYEALRAGVEPALDGAPLDDQRPARLARLLRRARRADGRLECGGAGCAGFDSAVPAAAAARRVARRGAAESAAAERVRRLRRRGLVRARGSGGGQSRGAAASCRAGSRAASAGRGAPTRACGGRRASPSRTGARCARSTARGAARATGKASAAATLATGASTVARRATARGRCSRSAAAASGGRGAPKPRAPRVYVLPMPPHLRFGVDFSPKPTSSSPNGC